MLNAKDLARLGLMVAILEVSKLALASLPNIELVSFWLILFTLRMGYRTLYAVYGFVLLEGILYGVHIWWIAYLYVWTLLVLLTQCFRSQQSVFFWSIFSALFGLCFGALCAPVYAAAGGWLYALTWWGSGIPMDLLHCGGNFVLALVLFRPLRSLLDKLLVQAKLKPPAPGI